MLHTTVYPTGDPAVQLTTYVHDRAANPANADRRPAVLVIPGGGYQLCSDRESEPAALALAGAGYQAFVLRYSVGQSSAWPTPLRDAEAALGTIMAGADEWGVDPDRIAALGFSAGGHLAASLATLGQVRPARTLLIYPVTSSETLRICHPATHTAPDLLAAVDASCPPTFLAHTAADQTVPVTDSLRFAGALADAGVPFELHIFPDGPHAMSLATPFTSSGRAELENPAFAGWLGLAVDWLGRQFPLASLGT